MKAVSRATRTSEAMVAAAKLAFGTSPVAALDKGTLELAHAGAAKVESAGLGQTATWAAPMTEDVMKEVLCDGAIHKIMEERIEKILYSKFEKAIKGRCPGRG